MLSIQSCALPEKALLKEYTRQGAYTDCYRTELNAKVTHEQFVSAFYTTLLFKLERLILKWAISKPSSDDQAVQLASGEVDSFAAWHVEARGENQVLMCDFKGRTRSWLMIEPVDTKNGEHTRLYFGSAVTKKTNRKTKKASFGVGFHLLIGFHRAYSVLLLYSAKLRLQRGRMPS